MLEVKGSRGWYSINIKGTSASILMAMPMKKPDALRLAKDMESWADWTLPASVLKSDKALEDRVRAKHEEIMTKYLGKG